MLATRQSDSVSRMQFDWELNGVSGGSRISQMGCERVGVGESLDPVVLEMGAPPLLEAVEFTPSAIL